MSLKLKENYFLSTILYPAKSSINFDKEYTFFEICKISNSSQDNLQSYFLKITLSQDLLYKYNTNTLFLTTVVNIITFL